MRAIFVSKAPERAPLTHIWHNTVNLALALTRRGHRTGLLDTDVFGPSVPTLLGLSHARAPVDPDPPHHLLPLQSYGLKSMSIGYLLPSQKDNEGEEEQEQEDKPIVWRGLMVMKALQQLLFQVRWGPSPGLDYLILDLPPGTGDTHLTISQSVPLAGALIVSSPQNVALKDAVKGISTWRKTDVPVLGLVSNFSYFQCGGCEMRHEIYGSQENLEAMARRMGVEVLARVPIQGRVSGDCDAGKPTVVAEPEGETAKIFGDLAGKVEEMVKL